MSCQKHQEGREELEIDRDYEEEGENEEEENQNIEEGEIQHSEKDEIDLILDENDLFIKNMQIRMRR